jgi:hypothetical protein
MDTCNVRIVNNIVKTKKELKNEKVNCLCHC